MQYGFGTSLKGNRCASEMVNCRDLTSLNLATLGARTICVTHMGLSTEIEISKLIYYKMGIVNGSDVARSVVQEQKLSF